MKPKNKTLQHLGLIALVFAGISAHSAQAAQLKWDSDTIFDGNFGGTGTWDTSTLNWSNASADQAWSTNTVTGDTAVFAGTAGTVTANSAINALGLKFTTTGYTLGGTGALTLGTGGIDLSSLTSGTTTIGNAITIGAGVQRWNVGTGATLAVGSLPTQYGPAGGIVILSNTGTITTTAADGWSWRSGAVANTGLLGPGFVIDNGNGTFDWASAGNSGGTIHAATYTTAVNGDAHNVRVTSNTTVSPNASWASLLVSGATLTANAGGSLYIDTGIILQNGGTIAGSAPIKSNNDGLYIYTPGTGGSISSSIQNNGANAKILYKAGTGSLNLSGNDTYTGVTNVWGGTLIVSGSGNINSTSGITVNASDAKYVHTSSTASTRTITLTQGTVDGTGTLATVNVANLASNTITNGNGGSSTLTIGTLAFSGLGTINITEANTTKGLALTTFTTANDGLGRITINAANSSAWNNGTTYDLITFTSITGGLTDFTKGTITGISGRQSATLGKSSTAITLAIAGDNPVWTGTGSQTWTTAATNNNTGPNAWALKTGHTATNFWASDAPEFNDTYNLGSGDVAVTNSTVTITGGVAPASTTFNNSAVDYVINSSDSTGITAGVLSKSGTGTVTLNTANSYAGATTINAGTLAIGGSGSLGSGSYAGTITNTGTFNYNSSAAQTLSGVISGAGAVNATGSGVLILSGSNSFSGQLTVSNGGTVNVASVNNASANGTLGNSALSVVLGGTGTNGTLEYSGGAGSVTTTKTFTLATGGTGTFQVDNASAELKLSAANGLTGSGQLIKTGAGTLAMGDAGHNFSGGTIVANGLLQGGNTLSTASFGTGAITLGLQGGSNNVAVGLGNGGVTAANNINVSSGSGTRTIVGGSGGDETFSGAVTLGDGGGAGNLYLTTVYVGSSSSKLFLSNTVSGTGNINMYGNNAYNVDSSRSFDVTLSGAQNQSGTISSIDAPGGVAYTTHGVNTISGALGSGITNVTQNSSNSTLVLSGTNTAFTGTVTVTNGTLKMGGASALNANSQVSVASAGTFDLNGNNETIGGLGTGTGSVTNTGAAKTLTLGGGASNSFGGVISASTPANLALTVALTGGATQTLTGVNTYAGATTINSGTLELSNDSAAGTSAISLSGASATSLKITMGFTVANDITFSNTNASSSVIREVASGTYDVGTTGNLTSNFTTDSKLDTTAKILAGTASAAATLTMSFGTSPTGTLSNDGLRLSDVFSLSGIALNTGTPAATDTDTFVIQLSATGLSTDSVLAWNDGTKWVNAVTGNTGGGSTFLGDHAYNNATDFTLGNYGYDSSTSSLWAVVNHTGQFAAIPELSNTLAGLLIGAGLLRRRRN